MPYSKHPGYIGPGDIWRRFKAGFDVTLDNVLTDESLWIIEPLTRWDANRLDEMLK